MNIEIETPSTGKIEATIKNDEKTFRRPQNQKRQPRMATHMDNTRNQQNR